MRSAEWIAHGERRLDLAPFSRGEKGIARWAFKKGDEGNSSLNLATRKILALAIKGLPCK
jgi:hypothetical protein